MIVTHGKSTAKTLFIANKKSIYCWDS